MTVLTSDQVIAALVEASAEFGVAAPTEEKGEEREDIQSLGDWLKTTDLRVYLATYLLPST